ncbi:MAG: hypothetical protein MK078_09725 [Crocinitomicaceae bacterium]|nr:hypothetical protein [Crocinitomicaceae bacterium]
MRSKITISSLLALVLLLSFSCNKNKNFTVNHLDFDQDTVLFDTVFTTVGSTTQTFKIYNNNPGKINIDEIELMGGESSPFRINVDGISADYLEDVEIRGRDSLFSFVEVTLEVNNTTNPLIIEDSVRFLTNGLNQYMHLAVWGQDAYFHNNEIVSGTWMNDKPHVLYGIVAVGFPGLDSNLNLTIPAGTDIYAHKDSRLLVYKSSIDIQGELNNEVTFRGDRLESYYDDIAGQWYGVHLIEAQTSTINYAIIKNGSVGVQVDSTMSPNTLTMTNTIINNSQFYNLLAVAGPNITIENCLMGDAGLTSVFLFAGGEYHFNHCNIVNYWTGGRGGPGLLMRNWFESDNVIYSRNIVNSEFQNCVFYGNSDKEWTVDTVDATVMDFEVLYNLIKRDETYDYSNYSNIVWNSDPLFTDPFNLDFTFDTDSPLNNAGTPSFVTSDIKGIARNISTPDIGCYEN